MQHLWALDFEATPYLSNEASRATLFLYPDMLTSTSIQIQAEDWARVEALFTQALWLQSQRGASADGCVPLLYQYATLQYVR